MVKAEEHEFIQKLKQRDEHAFDILVKKYKDHVFSLAFSMLSNREEARDLAQEVFISVFKAIDKFREDSSLQTWILRIATNHCINLLRYKQRRFYKQHEEYESEKQDGFVKYGYISEGAAKNPEDTLIGLELESIINKALNKMPVDQRLLIVLRDIEGLDYQEIGEILNIPTGTVKSRLHRARIILKELIDNYYKK